MSDSVTVRADRPAHKMEITPQMVEVGIEAYSKVPYGVIVSAIYRAMEEAKVGAPICEASSGLQSASRFLGRSRAIFQGPLGRLPV